MSKLWSGNNRARWHDYAARSIYHITLMKDPDAPYFGTLAGDHHLRPGIPGSPYLKASPLGSEIKECLRKIPDIHPALKVLQYALMPDHLHLILAVTSRMDEILGRKLAKFKVMVNNSANLRRVFANGYNDRIISNKRQLDIVYSYLRANPYRLAVRRAVPEFFTRRNDIIIGGEAYQAYGNLHLLDNPFKEQVVVHRADSDATRAKNHDVWMHCAANGGVLVSPFISPDEKAIRAEAETLAGRVILVSNIPLSDRDKPSAHDFDLFAKGRLLIIAPRQPIGLTRTSCLQMNALADTIRSMNN